MKKLTTLILMVVVCGAVWGQEDLFMGTKQLQFTSVPGGLNYIQSSVGPNSTTGLWTFKSRFDNLVFDAGINTSNQRIILFQTGGVERARLIPNGFWGFGTNAPKYCLDVVDRTHKDLIFRGMVSDCNTDYVSIGNATSKSKQFIPYLKGYHSSDNRFSLYISGETNVENDNGIYSVVRFDARNEGGEINNRPLFDWTNYGEQRMKMYANGNLHIGYQMATPGTEGLIKRLTLQPFGHTGGMWDFITRGENGSAYLDIQYGNNTGIAIKHSGDIGIGTPTPSAKLDVAGNIKAHEIEVTLAAMQDLQLNGTLAANNITYTANGNTADFVFEDNYQLKDLSEVEAFIKSNKHLPEVPSAAEMEEAGVNLAEMNKLLLMKVEELTLYAIEQKAEVERLKAEVGKVRSSESEVRKEIEKMTEDRRQETEELEERLAKMEALIEKLSNR